ncbi:MAG: M12 family metallopeptidase [Thermodesulfobacteriota bacterium]
MRSARRGLAPSPRATATAILATIQLCFVILLSAGHAGAALDPGRCGARFAGTDRLLRACLDRCVRLAMQSDDGALLRPECERACQREHDDAARTLREQHGCEPDGFEPVPTAAVGEETIVEGDIVILPADASGAGGAKGDGRPGLASTQGVGRALRDARWPLMTIPYWIDPALPWPERIAEAIRHWEAHTRVRFRAMTAAQRSAEASDFVEFTTGPGCSSPVGRQGGKQQIRLSFACGTAQVVHEIGHAVGLWHEQSRADRDAHLVVHWDNVRPGAEHNFSTYAEIGADGVDLGAFDFDSIMIYPSFIRDPAFVIDTERPTLTRHDGSTWIRTSRLSAGDVASVHLLYEDPVWIAPLAPPAGAPLAAGTSGDAVGRERGHDVFCLTGQACLAGDVNGDGRADLVSIDRRRPHRAWVALSDGARFSPNPGAVAWSDRVARRAKSFLLRDVDGDGRSDAIALHGGRTCQAGDTSCVEQAAVGDVWVALSEGARFAPPRRWHERFCTNEQTCHAADVDGDGRADLVSLPKRRKTAGVWVARSTGSAFAEPQPWHPTLCEPGTTCRLADVDGDSRADVVVLDGAKGEIRVARSNGGAFVLGPASATAALAGADLISTGDVDADGRADVVAFSRAAGTVRVARSTGGGFVDAGDGSSSTVCQAGETCLLADVTGDGTSEVIAYQP